jgi:diguanylate cyclase (GGDEF)-like protein/PAS domain S-box-containing protein
MNTLNNYLLEEKLYEGNHSIVYRGHRNADSQPKSFIFKILKKGYPPPEEVAKFRREYETTRDLGNRVSGVIHAYGIEKYKNSFAMILEDFGGESLEKLKQEKRLKPDLTRFLHLALQITDILAEIHGQQVIHKDINPSNIIRNPITNELKIIDFGIAAVLPHETVEHASPNAIEGTLAYMSPEQTGRMNRSLDYRTDFYSLGVTFYELLTSRLPFETEDPMELVHAHIARVPPAPHQLVPEIPPVISRIIMKLMAKNAEERYRNALGLKHDLQRCLEQVTAAGRCEDFEIGRKDFSHIFQVPQKLYGRQTEMAVLLGAFERASQGTPQMMLVAGYAGIGKTSLVQEVCKPIVQKRGYFISGKFDQFKQNNPYAPMVQAFQELVRQLLTENEEQMTRWNAKILAAVGANGQVIIDIIPAVKWIIGRQEPVPELPPPQAQNRFNRVFLNFIRVFAAPDHPLTIYLDDLQWIDLPSLKLIELLMTEVENRGLFLIGAYRDNEVNAAHPLIQAIDTLTKKGKHVHTITLPPLGPAEVNRLIADALHCSPGTTSSLSRLCLKKTGGNPFFLKEFLRTLYRQKLIEFDNKTLSWHWKLGKIEQAGITENVVDLMVGKIRNMNQRTQDALKWAAAVGGRFTLKTLSLVIRQSCRQITDDLWEPLREDLILPTDEKYKYARISNQPGLMSIAGLAEFKFSHDRIQQAAYSLIDEDAQGEIHLKIGRLLLENTPREKLEEKIFDILNHLHAGLQWVTRPDDLIDTARLDLLAARKAKSSAAYPSALEYAAMGVQLLRGLPGDSWQNQYELTYELYKEHAEIEYLNGNFDRAQSLIMLTLEKARSNVEKAELYGLLIVMYTLQARYQQAIEVGRNALKLFGILLPHHNLKEEILKSNEKLMGRLKGKRITSLLEAPEMKDPEKRAALKVLCALGPLCYRSDYELMALSAMEMINLGLDYGFAPELGYACVTYGMVIVTYVGDFQLAYELGWTAIIISERFQDFPMKCQTCLIFDASINHWLKHIKEGAPITEEGFRAGLDSGELQYTGYLLLYKNLHAFYQGKNIEDILRDIPKDLLFCKKTGNQWAIDALSGCQGALNNLSGKTGGMLSFDMTDTTEMRYLKRCRSRQSFFALTGYMVMKAQVLYLYGYFDRAHRGIACARKRSIYVTTCILQTDINFYESLLITARFKKIPGKQKKEYLKRLENNQKQMKTWADNCPANFLHKYFLVEAERARITGKKLAAMNLYDRAIESARENKFVQHEALANERAAKFYLKLGLKKIAGFYMADALYGYKMWGADRKVRQLEAAYSRLLAVIFQRKELFFDAALEKRILYPLKEKAKTPASPEIFDWMTFLKACDALSSEIALEKLLKKIMGLVMTNAGAEKGVFLLVEKRDEKETLVVEAVGAVDDPDVRVMQSIPLEELKTCNLPPMLCEAVINYTAHTKERVILHDAAHEGQFIHDPYVKTKKTGSVLCMPLIYRGELIGVLYLENNLVCGAFTEERVHILDLLSAKMAISIVNARIHDRLEESVKKRTTELKIANEILRSEIAERRTVEKELLKSERRYRNVSELTSDCIYEISVNPEGEMVIEWISREFMGLTGFTLEEVRCLDKWKDVVHAGDFPALMQMFQTILSSGRSGEHEVRFIKKTGDFIWLRIFGRPEWDDRHRNVIGIVGAARDITQSKTLEEKLQAEAITDELTGLYNRRGFFTFAEQQCKLARRTKRRMSLLYLDLDDLKAINDRFGHNIGDEALIDAANILKHAFRGSDIIARIGGDEFAVLLTEHSDSDIEPIITNNIRERFHIHNEQGGRSYELAFSMGIARFNPLHPGSVSDLLIRADAAMYENKKQKKLFTFEEELIPGEGEKEFKKRRYKRYDVDEYWSELVGLDTFEIKNISSGGLCLKSKQKLPINNIYNIEIHSPFHRGIKFKGSVVWSTCVEEAVNKEDDKPQYEAGMKFIELDGRFSPRALFASPGLKK